MPSRDLTESSGLMACPQCGHMNPADAIACAQCGMDLGLEDSGPLDFEEFDEGAHDEGPEAEGFDEVEAVDDGPAADMRGVPRATARQAPGGRPLPGPPQMRPGRPGMPPRLVPPPGPPRGASVPPGQTRPGPVGGPAPQTPSKPQAPPAPVDYAVKREQVLQKFTLYLFILGAVNLALSYGLAPMMTAAKVYENTWAGYVILDLIMMGIIIFFALYSGNLAAKSTDKTTFVEEKNISRTTMGIGALLLIFIIQVLGIHRVIPGVPDPGNYNSGWSILYILIALPGIVLLIKGLYAIREKLSYFKIWRFGVWLLVLAPATGALDALSPLAGPAGTTILNYQFYFAYSVAALFIVIIVVAFGLKGRLGEMYSSLESETKRGEDFFKSGRYREAMNSFDSAIDLGHELFAQYFYDPDSPRLASVRLPSQYGIPWLRKGDIYVQLRKPRKAIAIYDVILELDPRNEVVWNRKGEVLLSMGKFQESLRCFDQALSAVPTYVKSSQNKQKAVTLMRQAAEATGRVAAAQAVEEPEDEEVLVDAEFTEN